MAAPATRTELLALRRRTTLAREGERILEEKRQALVRELVRSTQRALEQAGDLDTAAAAALEALDLARGMDGPGPVRSSGFASAATGDRFEVTLRASNVMGVSVPMLEVEPRRRGLLERGYSLPFSSASVDRVAETFEDELLGLVRYAEADVRIRRVGGEIQRTARRVNALRYAVIPALDREVRRIAAVLREQEREGHTRLKHLKRRRTASPVSASA